MDNDFLYVNYINIFWSHSWFLWKALVVFPRQGAFPLKFTGGKGSEWCMLSLQRSRCTAALLTGQADYTSKNLLPCHSEESSLPYCCCESMCQCGGGGFAFLFLPILSQVSLPAASVLLSWRMHTERNRCNYTVSQTKEPLGIKIFFFFF